MTDLWKDHTQKDEAAMAYNYTMTIKAISVALALASLSTGAQAQQADPYHACAAEQDAAARLACFDRVDSARHPTTPAPSTAPPVSAAPAPVRAPVPAAAPVVPSPANPDIGLDARQARRERAQRGEPEPAQAAVIVATVVSVIPRSALISAFVLSNGQVWEQAESTKFSADPQQTVTIRPGLLGAFFLKNAAGASVRVHRLK